MKTQAELSTIAHETVLQMKQTFPDTSMVVLVWNNTEPALHCALAADAPNRAQVIKNLRAHADAMEREHGAGGLIIPVRRVPPKV